MHPLRWPWLTLIACAAASGNAVAQTTAAPAAAAEPPAEESAKPEREWVLPPLRLTGSVSYDTRYLRADDGGSSWSNVVTTTINTSTYLYQPWVATLGATLGLSGSWTRTNGGATGDASLHEQVRAREAFITGSTRLNLFPRSRFPAEVHWERQDSRTSSGLIAPISFTRQNVGATMRYQPPDGAYTLSGAYDHSVQSSGSLKQSQDALSADFSRRWNQHDVSLGASHTRARSEGFDDESRFTSVVGRHAYSPSSALSVSSTANLTRSEENSGFGSDLQVMQLASVAFYRPEKSPYTLTGSLRGIMLRDPTIDLENDSFGATLGTNYEISPQLRLNANGGFNVSRTRNDSSTGFTGSLGAAYQGLTREFGGFQYDWYTGASLGSSVSSGSSMERQVEYHGTAHVGHALNRTWRMSEESFIGMNASQSVSASYAHSNSGDGSGLGSSKSLLNNLSLNWSRSAEGRSATARASYSDTFELGGGSSRFQMFNLQLSGNLELGYGRSLTGDLGYQITQQRQSTLLADPLLGPIGGRTRTTGVSGEIQFQQNNLFNVPRLRFVSRLRLAHDVLKQPGQLLSIPDRETRLWENRLDWSIGRLDTQLVLRLSEFDGRRVDSVWLRINRAFGN